jgi:hypothetical protein
MTIKKPAAFACALVAQPAVAAIILAALAYGVAWVTRYGVVEPQEIGTFCRAADAPLWCGARTALIRVTEVGGLGLASIALAAGALVAGGRAARVLVMAAMVSGGAGLILYNTTYAALGVLVALLRASRLGGARPGSSADAAQFAFDRAPER